MSLKVSGCWMGEQVECQRVLLDKFKLIQHVNKLL
jgi:hypothetical protein